MALIQVPAETVSDLAVRLRNQLVDSLEKEDDLKADIISDYHYYAWWAKVILAIPLFLKSEEQILNSDWGRRTLKEKKEIRKEVIEDLTGRLSILIRMANAAENRSIWLSTSDCKLLGI